MVHVRAKPTHVMLLINSEMNPIVALLHVPEPQWRAHQQTAGKSTMIEEYVCATLLQIVRIIRLNQSIRVSVCAFSILSCSYSAVPFRFTIRLLNNRLSFPINSIMAIAWLAISADLLQVWRKIYCLTEINQIMANNSE